MEATSLAEARVINYTPAGPVVQSFLHDEHFVRGIMGPLGSGKSTACVLEILRRSMQQVPSPDGFRRTRWAIIRNTYPELKTTTLKTWGQWCPLEFGKLTQDSPITHYVKTPELDMEVLFLALDREDDIRKLLSLELTGAWLNEAREIPKSILDAITGRVGRYPPRVQGGATWSGVLMDTNPPDDQSWWYALAENGCPNEFRFFKQPGGDSSEAENLANLPNGYYTRLKAGKDADWIKVYIQGEYGFVTEGKAVFPMYRDSTHTSPTIIEPIPVFPLLIGADFGLTPAAIIGQKLPDGRWHVLDEVVTDNHGVIRFAELLCAYVAKNYPGYEVGGAWGDPAGNVRGSNDERTALELMTEHTGWRWKPAPSNEITMRLEVVKAALNRMVDGKPGLLVSPKAATLRKGFTGGYHHQAVRTGNGTEYHETPRKNAYSHPHDAFQYLLLGGGEHHVVMNRVKRANRRGQVQMARDVDYDIFGDRD